jgi:predicted nucleic acid-binding protein
LIYLDSSVVLARLLDESRSPPDEFWSNAFVSSRLTEYEVINRLLSRSEWSMRTKPARLLLDAVEFLELTPDALARALQPFPLPVRTLDALHLATMEYLRSQGQDTELATYDRRLAAAAQALGFSLAALA